MFSAFIALSIALINVDFAYAVTQKITFKLEGDCVTSNYTGVIQENRTRSCLIVGNLNPAKPTRTAYLEYKDQLGVWRYSDDDYGDRIRLRIDTSRNFAIKVPQYDSDSVFYEFSQREFRVYLPKAGISPSLISKPFTIKYLSDFDQ